MSRFGDLLRGEPTPAPKVEAAPAQKKAPAPKPVAKKPKPPAPKIEEPVDEPRVEEEVSGDEESE